MNTSTLNIGISIAEPTDMNLWGISPTHIKDAMMEVARYAINSGYSISYGGDLCHKDSMNFVEVLKEIVMRYSTDWQGVVEKKYITNYLAWHIGKETSDEVKKSFSEFINIINTPAPVEIKKNDQYEIVKKSKLLKARALTKMREVMNNQISVRVLLAGKITGSSGIYPGLIEESYLALKSKKPVFLLGGFGGCTHKIIELLEKKRPIEISLEYQINNDRQKKQLICEYEYESIKHPEYNYPLIDYNNIILFFEEIGIEGLNNGLSVEENMVLFETRNIKEMLRLLFKGLSIVSNKIVE